MVRSLFTLALAMTASTAGAQSLQPAPPPADPLTAIINTEDVDRFAKLWRETNGKPTAAQLQRDYLDKGSYGVSVFTPGRIENAKNLAAVIARDPKRYDDAVNLCLPRIASSTGDLRSTYLALQGLFPDARLPQVYMVIGANNSGGTADSSAQVLGLEILCADNQTPEKLRQTLAFMFAHETVHSLQKIPAHYNDAPFLNQLLMEGAADFIAALITGEQPAPERAAWAEPREHALWTALQADLAQAKPPLQRWMYNYQSAPQGWHSDVGYWMGQRIWQSYYDQAADKRQAVHDMLDWGDARTILEKSGYAASAKGEQPL